MRGDLRGSTAFSAACFGHGWPQDGQATMLGAAVEVRPSRATSATARSTKC